ncbi:UNVERIFIED_CONTAM: hypothetical protein FKN15_052443 [Acipenser sinensis]
MRYGHEEHHYLEVFQDTNLEWEEPERPAPELEEPELPAPEWEEPESPQPKRGESVRPQPKRWESVRPQPKRGGVGASTAQEVGVGASTAQEGGVGASTAQEVGVGASTAQEGGVGASTAQEGEGRMSTTQVPASRGRIPAASTSTSVGGLRVAPTSTSRGRIPAGSTSTSAGGLRVAPTSTSRGRVPAGSTSTTVGGLCVPPTSASRGRVPAGSTSTTVGGLCVPPTSASRGRVPAGSTSTSVGGLCVAPPPSAEGEYLLFPPPPPWEDDLQLPPPPAEEEYLLVLPPSPPPAEGACLLDSPLQPEGDEPLPPSQPKGEEPLPPLQPEGEEPLPPLQPEGEEPLPPSQPEGEEPLPPPLQPEGQEALPPLQPEGQEALPPLQPEGQEALPPLPSQPEGEEPLPPLQPEGEVPLSPSQPEGEVPRSPPEGLLLLPSPPKGPLPLPSPPEGPLLLPSPPESPLLLPSPGVIKGPALPGVATCPAIRQEIMWLEPHEGKLPATKKGGEVRRPALPAAVSLPEIGWPEPHGGELSATKKGGEQPAADTRSAVRAAEYMENTLSLITQRVHKIHRRSLNATDILTPEDLSVIARLTGCEARITVPSCNTNALVDKYRTITSVCNNKRNPRLGASNTPLSRWLPSQYEDGVHLPKGWDPNRLYSGFHLPLARAVSNHILHTPNDNLTQDNDFAYMLVLFGQWTDHDLGITPTSPSVRSFNKGIHCDESCDQASPCFPIKIPPNDTRIHDTDSCIPFFRSAPACGTGTTGYMFGNANTREQINALTSFVDASMVYGSEEPLSRKLRNLKSDLGLMAVNDEFRDDGLEFLLFNKMEMNMCTTRRSATSDQSLSEVECFLILIYREYLPRIVGREAVDTYLKTYSGYDESVDPGVANVFSTAAFLFAHLTIQPFMFRLNEIYQEHPEYPSVLLHKAFFTPWRLVFEGGVDPILRGLIGKPAKLNTQDKMMHEELRERLFKLTSHLALDLDSLNIQRSRDHGLPGYNDWRRFCGLSEPKTVDELAEVLSNRNLSVKLLGMYGSPDNIDIWMGGISEPFASNARVGPLFACLIATQFQKIRNSEQLIQIPRCSGTRGRGGARSTNKQSQPAFTATACGSDTWEKYEWKKFWWEKSGTITESQRNSLRTVSLSRIICDNTKIQEVPENVFQYRPYSQGYTRCSQIPSFDLSPWQENTSEMGYSVRH